MTGSWVPPASLMPSLCRLPPPLGLCVLIHGKDPVRNEFN